MLKLWRKDFFLLTILAIVAIVLPYPHRIQRRDNNEDIKLINFNLKIRIGNGTTECPDCESKTTEETFEDTVTASNSTLMAIGYGNHGNNTNEHKIGQRKIRTFCVHKKKPTTIKGTHPTTEKSTTDTEKTTKTSTGAMETTTKSLEFCSETTEAGIETSPEAVEISTKTSETIIGTVSKKTSPETTQPPILTTQLAHNTTVACPTKPDCIQEKECQKFKILVSIEVEKSGCEPSTDCRNSTYMNEVSCGKMQNCKQPVDSGDKSGSNKTGDKTQIIILPTEKQIIRPNIKIVQEPPKFNRPRPRIIIPYKYIIQRMNK